MVLDSGRVGSRGHWASDRDVHVVRSHSVRPGRRAGGRAGARLKVVGTNAREQIEKMLGTKVHLELFVKVAKDWQRDPRQLRKLGF